MSEIEKEYAKALFMIALESEMVTEYEKALDFIVDVFHETPMYMEFLINPGIALRDRLDAVDDAFSKIIPKDVISFLKLLCKKGNIRKFYDCTTQYKRLTDMFLNTSKAKIISAIELTIEEKKTIVEKLKKISGHTVIAEYIVDKSILGGIIIFSFNFCCH